MKYLNPADKKQLQEMNAVYKNQLFVLKGLEQLMQSFIQSKFEEYGLDSTKHWRVDQETGKIEEVKDEQPK